MKRILLSVWCAFSIVISSACLPQAASLPTPTLSATETPAPPTFTPTPTIVWFPPTATPTPFATRGPTTPTPEVRLTYGSLVFEDSFKADSPWGLKKDATGSVAFGRDELTLAVSSERGYLFSLRSNPSLVNFYVEITASPSLCRQGDEYGLLLRYSENTGFYRFALTCHGEARVDRFFGGRASSPQPPIMSGAVPPGAPSTSRLGVFANGKEMRFYVNGEFLFTVQDPSLSDGLLGVFARAASDSPLTVNFSDLAVYKTTP